MVDSTTAPSGDEHVGDEQEHEAKVLESIHRLTAASCKRKLTQYIEQPTEAELELEQWLKMAFKDLEEFKQTHTKKLSEDLATIINNVKQTESVYAQLENPGRIAHEMNKAPYDQET